MNVPTHKSLLHIKIFWWGIIFLAAIAAFSMLRRDAAHHFGGVSFGVFPAFHFKDAEGMLMDDHQLRARVTVIHTVVNPAQGLEVAKKLNSLSEITASGKRRLFVLSFAPKDILHFVSLSKTHVVVQTDIMDIQGIFKSLGSINDNIVYVIDQNGVIRGRYDLTNMDDTKALSENVIRLL